MDSTDQTFLRCPKAGLNEDGNTGDEGRDAESFGEFCPTVVAAENEDSEGHCRVVRVSLRVQCGEGSGRVHGDAGAIRRSESCFSGHWDVVLQETAHLRTRKVEMVGMPH